jgi:hypothetical protein
MRRFGDGDPATTGARCSSPRRSARAAEPRRLLAPVRPGVGTDDAAPGADHAGAECRYVIRPRFGTQDHPVVALPAAHVERPHAIGAHVAQCHRRASLRSWSCTHAGEDIRASSATASSGRCALPVMMPACRSRRRRDRGGDLAYLGSMPAAQAGARRWVHEADADAIATARAVAASRREGRAQRRALPRVQSMKVLGGARQP